LSDQAPVSDGEVFLELASGMRRSILIALDGKKLKLSQLAESLDMTIQESHRQFARLANAGLVRKDPEGLLSLTTYGKIVAKQIPCFDFLERNESYFRDHSFGELPLKFIHRLAALNNSEPVDGVVAVLERFKGMLLEAKEHVWVISPQIPSDVSMLGIEVFTKGVKLSILHSKNTIAPKGSFNEIDKRLRGLISKGTVERRMVERASIAVVFNERQHCCVGFANSRGDGDINYMLFSRDPHFFEWCYDYFQYEWSRSDDWDGSRIREI
jgi:predicted transcriptional regulator